MASVWDSDFNKSIKAIWLCCRVLGLNYALVVRETVSVDDLYIRVDVGVGCPCVPESLSLSVCPDFLVELYLHGCRTPV